MPMGGLIASWLQRLRKRRADRHRSGWDNPVTGTDLLAAMLNTNKQRGRLP